MSFELKAPVVCGWFDAPGQDEPTFDPRNAPCPVCGLSWVKENVRTVGVMGRKKSLFFRIHRACDDALTSEERGLIDLAALAQEETPE